ncbi:hypothetical protein LPJ63_004639 [Coemansia sp. RSA 2711]|nr:hypothetical protein LPJ63_004639 [Coemansia sp. RSA 2711]KAJ2377399.1 hypothetical protein H4S02_007663 [Coemansia sp. RSA 2611]
MHSHTRSPTSSNHHLHDHDENCAGGERLRVTADGDCEASEQEAEANALMDVVAAFLSYKTFVLNSGIYRRLHHIDELSERHREIVSSLGTIDKIKNAEKLVRENYKFVLGLVHSSSVGEMPNPVDDPEEFKRWYQSFCESRTRAGSAMAKSSHMEKVLSTLKQFVRDWSEEGERERAQTYGPILQALEDEFAHVAPRDRGNIHVLVPGAGLGRLAFDICCRGFSCQGNEFSYFMLLASNFILNKSEVVNQHTIYPFVHQFSNVVSASDQLRAVRVPDVLPSEMPYAETARFSMSAGDFIEIYGAEDQWAQWDAIVTCFFMDTANNVLAYLDAMWNAMKPGAVWINIGPLLWHFDNIEGESSIELTRDEFVALVTKVGFVMEEQQFKKRISATYTANSRSMLQYTYHSFMCVARKPE